MTQTWSEIAKYYEELSEMRPLSDVFPMRSMLRFVRQIERSSYEAGLVGHTSMHDLCISQTHLESPFYRPYLRITPMRENRIEFRYLDSYVKENQWHRTVDADDAFARLEGFLDQLHWFVAYKPVTTTEREDTQ